MAILATRDGTLPDDTLRTAVDALRQGLVLGIPTDTVYGLAVSPFVPGATDRLFAVKRRPRDVALPVLVAGVEQAGSLVAGVSPVAAALMDRFWPGPLTIVLARPPDPHVALDLGENRETVGIRCPDHPVPLALCRRAGPLATTSANLHKEATAETAADVVSVFGDDVPYVVDGGPARGLPSTVVDCTGTELRLLREGRLPWASVLEAAGATVHGRAE
jgi:L-threonylcarbamoyladenylate synthase